MKVGAVGPSIFMLDVFRTADHAGHIFIPHRPRKSRLSRISAAICVKPAEKLSGGRLRGLETSVVPYCGFNVSAVSELVVFLLDIAVHTDNARHRTTRRGPDVARGPDVVHH